MFTDPAQHSLSHCLSLARSSSRTQQKCSLSNTARSYRAPEESGAFVFPQSPSPFPSGAAVRISGFFPAVTPSFSIPQHQVWDFCLLTQLISPLQKKKPSRLPKIFTFLFCTLEFFLYLALFCQRQGILPFSILFLSYISEKLKFLKTFFTLAVTQLCHTSSAFLHLYSFLYCAYFCLR